MPRKRPTTEAEWEAKRAEDRARYHANPSAQYEASKRWKNKNRESLNEKRRKKRAAHRAENPLPVKKEKTPEEIESARLALKKKRHLAYLANKDEIAAKVSTPEALKKRRERKRLWRLSNPDKVAAENEARRAARGHPGPKRQKMTPEESREMKRKSSRESRRNNPEPCRARSRQWRLDNPERYKASLRSHYQKNKEKICAQTGQWKKDNPERVRSINAAREARIKGLIHPESSREKMDAVYRESSRMTRETGVDHETDHIIPTAKNGYHHQDNLQTMTASMNASKQDDPLWISPHVGIKDWRDVPRHLWPIDLVPKYLALLEKHKGESIRWDTAA